MRNLRKSKAQGTMSFMTQPGSHTPSFLKFPIDTIVIPTHWEGLTTQDVLTRERESLGTILKASTTVGDLAQWVVKYFEYRFHTQVRLALKKRRQQYGTNSNLLRLNFCLPPRMVPQVEIEFYKNANFVLAHLNLCTEIQSQCVSCKCSLKLTAKVFSVHHSSSVAVTLSLKCIIFQ